MLTRLDCLMRRNLQRNENERKLRTPPQGGSQGGRQGTSTKRTIKTISVHDLFVVSVSDSLMSYSFYGNFIL